VVLFILKALASVLLLLFLFLNVDAKAVVSVLLSISPLQFFVVILVLLAQALIAAWRWSLVCQLLSMRVKLGRLFLVLLVGLFFNQLLPSTICGDAARVWLLRKPLSGSFNAGKSVVADRAVGFFVLFAIVFAVALSSSLWRDIFAFGYEHIVLGFVFLCFALGVTGILVLKLEAFCLNEKILRVIQLIYQVRTVFSSGTKTINLFGVSAFIHVMSVATIWFLARCLGLEISLIDFLVIIPTVTLIISIPITISGWGLREGLLVYALGFVGVSTNVALALSLLFATGQMVLALIGCAVWLVLKPD